MRSRELLSEHPGIRRRIASEFIPLALNQEYFEGGEGARTEATEWLRGVTQRMQRLPGTRQGYYIIGADGSGPMNLTHPNIDNAPALARFLDEGLAFFRARPPKPVQIDPAL